MSRQEPHVTKVSKKEQAAILRALRDTPSDYEARNRASGFGVKVALEGGVFWSRGWRACRRCGGRVDIPVELQPFVQIQDGTVTKGWCCRPT